MHGFAFALFIGVLTGTYSLDLRRRPDPALAAAPDGDEQR